jgi:hypothetical protein
MKFRVLLKQNLLSSGMEGMSTEMKVGHEMEVSMVLVFL